ncbi:MAG: carbohydrate ABC transporter permease [Nitrospinales bacterium]
MRILLRNPAFWLILPSLLLPLLIIAYPIFDVFRASTHYVTRLGMIKGFIGLDNFVELFQDPIFIESLIRTIWWTIFVVGGTQLVAIPVALILSEDFWGRGVVRVIIMLPWAMSLAMSAIVWKWTFNGQFGMLNYLLETLGILDKPFIWLALAENAFMIEIFVGIIVSIPFTVTILLGGLSSIPRDIYEAAEVDGATELQRFTRLTLPLLKPFINIALVLNIIYVFNSFPIIWVMTRGGPNNGTHILITYIYQRAFEFGKIGQGAAGSIIMLIILLTFSILYLTLMREKKEA